MTTEMGDLPRHRSPTAGLRPAAGRYPEFGQLAGWYSDPTTPRLCASVLILSRARRNLRLRAKHNPRLSPLSAPARVRLIPTVPIAHRCVSIRNEEPS